VLRSPSCPSSLLPWRAAAAGPLLPAAAGPIVARQAHGSRSFVDLVAPDGPTNSRRQPLVLFITRQPAPERFQRAMIDDGLAGNGRGSWLARFTARRPRPLTVRQAPVSGSFLCPRFFHWLSYCLALSHHGRKWANLLPLSHLISIFIVCAPRFVAPRHTRTAARQPQPRDAPPSSHHLLSLLTAPLCTLYSPVCWSNHPSLFSVHIQNLTTS
jgi:hypothetical protein